MPQYTTYGHVRGCSGVLHRSLEAAERAVARDKAACRTVGGYSDRHVAVVVDGGLYHDEAGTDPVWPSYGRGNGAARFRRD